MPAADTFHPDESLRYLRALGDPDRLKIVQCLRSGPKSVGEIRGVLRTPLANVSHHLGMLKEAGIVSAKKRGRFVIYELQHVVGAAQAGKHLLDFGCCRIEFVEKPNERASSSHVESDEQALLILNRILGQSQKLGSKSSTGRKTTTKLAKTGRKSRHIEIANGSFESPATPFFDTAVTSWTKEGDPSGTGVFRNFPDDKPLPGSRFVEDADGEQLGTVGAKNPGGDVGPSGLFQSLAGTAYVSGSSYLLTLGVGGSSVQPPTSDGSLPPSIRFALTYEDDAGKRHEVVGRSVTPADFAQGSRLTYLSVATTLSPELAPACVGRRIGIYISTTSNTPAHAGHFIVDNVTLVVDAPPRRSRRAGGNDAVQVS